MNLNRNKIFKNLFYLNVLDNRHKLQTLTMRQYYNIIGYHDNMTTTHYTNSKEPEHYMIHFESS